MRPSFALLLADSARGRAYIQWLCRSNLLPSEVLLMPGAWQPPATVANSQSARGAIGFDPCEDVRTTIERYALRARPCSSDNVNAPETIRLVAATEADLVVFGGPGGQILKRDMLNSGKQFLHLHPGGVPAYRGSTTVYYALLQDGQCCVSALLLSEGIDEGPVMLQRCFPSPSALNVDLLFDPDIRARTLVDVLTLLRERGRLDASPQPPDPHALPYFVIHPVLKHLALLATNCH